MLKKIFSLFKRSSPTLVERLEELYGVPLSPEAFKIPYDFSLLNHDKELNDCIFIEELGAASFVLLMDDFSKIKFLKKINQLGYLPSDNHQLQYLNKNGNDLLAMYFHESLNEITDTVFKVLTNDVEVINYLCNTNFQISPPWVYFPEPDIDSRWFSQGQGDFWLWSQWLPFWNNASFIEKYEYLKRYRASSYWFDVLTDYELSTKLHFYKTGDKYGEFSNFYPAPIQVDGLLWLTVEHYFQAQKFTDKVHQEIIRAEQSPMKAALLGRQYHPSYRMDWDENKDQVMYKALEAKFAQHISLSQLLVSTKGSEIIEHTSNDNYWADGGDGSGLNKLGCFLMAIRGKYE